MSMKRDIDESMIDPGSVRQRLTVGKLKELLKDIPDHYVVSTEGCDCVGPSDGIWDAEDCREGQVVISRNDYLRSM